MDRERWARIKDAFGAVVAERPEQWQSALDNICRSDADLRAEVQELLQYHQEESGFLESSIVNSNKNLLHAGDLLAERYRIQAFLGCGGMAEVYEAEDCKLGEHVALKVIYPRLRAEKTSLDRFCREVQFARQVTHPNVCRVFDIGHDQQPEREIVFLTMELIRGETLAARLKRTGRLPPREALSVALQLCRGLGAAHDAGVLHRDFKPGNVLLSESQSQVRASITDFGIARSLRTADAPSVQSTAPGVVLGTPAYMSPEQLMGEPLTIASDIYSLGLVLYEMITGAKPFGDSVRRRLTENPEEPTYQVPDLDPRWNQAILRCLRRDPRERFGSASDIAAYLTGQSAEHEHGIQENEIVIHQDYRKDRGPFGRVPAVDAEIMVHPGLTMAVSKAHTKNAESVVPKKRGMTAPAIAAILFVAAVTGYLFYLYRASEKMQEAAPTAALKHAELPLFSVQWLLTLANRILQVVLMAIMRRNKSRARFPLFFNLILLGFVTLMLEVVVFWKADLFPQLSDFYFYFYWPMNAAGIVLTFGAIREVFIYIFKPTLLELGKFLFRWAALFLALTSGFTALAASGTQMNKIVSIIDHLEGSCSLMACGLLLFFILFQKRLGIPWRTPASRIIVGLGVNAGVSLAVSSLSTHIPSWSNQLNLAEAIWCLALYSIWCISFALPEPERKDVEDSPSRLIFQRWNETLVQRRYQSM